MLLTDNEWIKRVCDDCSFPNKGVGIFCQECRMNWEVLEDIFLSKILEAVDGAGLTPEQQFNLHFDTPYSCKSARMSAFLKGVDGGAQAMKQAILKAIKGEK